MKTILALILFCSLSVLAQIPPAPLQWMEMAATPKAASGLLSVSDNFTRGNSSNLGANWTKPETGISGFSIASDLATSAASGISMDYWSANTFHNDQYSQITINAQTQGATYAYAFARMATGNNGYGVAGDGSGIYLQTFYSGSYSRTVYSWSAVVSNGDTLRVSCTGTTISVYHNGSFVGSVTDSTFASGYAGIGANDGAVTLSGWTAGNND